MTKIIKPERYSSIPEDCRFETLAIRWGQERTHFHEHAEPVFMTSSYVFSTAAEAAGVFAGELPGNVYSRYTNPTVTSFETRMAALEQADQAVATASGMSAILSVCMAFLQTGDEIVCSRSVFGTTVTLFNKYMAAFGVRTTYVELTNLNDWEKACTDKTKLFFLESPSNPLNEVADLTALSQLAKKHQALLVVDNCFCTPILQKPLTLGADVVVHSATKYLDGQGRSMGGVVCGSAKLMEEVGLVLRAAGPTISPFNAWLLVKSLETLPVRMQAHCRNAKLLARWLMEHEAVSEVFYTGLENHPQHELAKAQQNGFGAVVAFTVVGGQEQAWQVIDSTRLLSITANLGDTRTTITHPASTTHCRLSDEAKKETGITPNLLRVALGLEHIEDLIADLKRGLDTLLP